MFKGKPPRGSLLPARNERDSAPAWTTYEGGVLFVVDHKERPVGREFNGLRWCDGRVWAPFLRFLSGNPKGKGQISPSPRKVNPKLQIRQKLGVGDGEEELQSLESRWEERTRDEVA